MKMTENKNPLTLKAINGLASISSQEWNACAGETNPFVSYEFLSALEDSGSVCAETGWLPQHIIAQNKDGALQAAAPCYLKNHSYGEYVFDWGWAEAFERAGGTYYPKLQVAVPFTPVTGPRLLVRDGEDLDYARTNLISGLKDYISARGVSSLHITFCDKQDYSFLSDSGFLKRIGKQFHWYNQGYSNFDDFLDNLTSRKRKAIRKERKAANQGLKIETLSGMDLKESHLDAFYNFYLNTVDKKWAHAYLNRDFFSVLRERLADKVVLFFATKDQEPIAAALNLRGKETLYGRNWGCSVQWPMLYFELCFYRAIDYAIEENLGRVEAGAQGPHKISRGYLPSETFSAHWIKHDGFKEAVSRFLDQEKKETEAEMLFLEQSRSPYKQG